MAWEFYSIRGSQLKKALFHVGRLHCLRITAAVLVAVVVSAAVVVDVVVVVTVGAGWL